MNRTIIIFLLCTTTTPILAQVDTTSESSIEETRHYFTAGIYLSFTDFINNSPIEPWQIETSFNSESRDFYTHLVGERGVNVSNNDSTFSINPRTMWGYSDGKGVYLNRSILPNRVLNDYIFNVSENPWAKINILGSVSLIYYEKAINSNHYQTGTNMPIRSKDRDKGVEFILNLRDGTIVESTLKNLKILIADDGELLYELKKSKIDKDIILYVFLKKYNERHPLKFK